MKRSTIARTGAFGAACALAGSAAGIAASSASTPHKPRPAPLMRRYMFKAGPLAGVVPRLGPLVPGGPAGPAVHSESVVPNEKGGFDTVTMDSGKLSSLSGEQLTIAEGTKTATYKTVTLTIPSDATVYRDGEKAQVSDIKPGDTVTVVQSSSGTLVNAFDAQHEPKLQLKRLGRPPGGEGPPPGALKPSGPPEGVGSQAGEGGEGSSSS